MRLKTLFALAACSLLTWPVLQPAAFADEAEEKQTVEVFDKATLNVPGDFERTAPKNNIVQDEFVAKAGEGDDVKTARLYMMQSGGSLQANLDRWRGQFSGNDDAFEKKEMNVGKWKVVVAEHKGTYAERMGGGPFAPGRTVQRPDYAMLGAIIAPPEPQGRNYYVKMIGHEDVIKENKDSFMKMIKSLKE